MLPKKVIGHKYGQQFRLKVISGSTICQLETLFSSTVLFVIILIWRQSY